MTGACLETQMREAMPRLLADLTPKAIAHRVRAQGVRVSEFAAKAWKRADGNLPAAHHMMALEKAFPEVAAEMRRIRALPGENPSESDALAATLIARIEALMNQQRA